MDSLDETSSVDDVFAWLNSNGFNEFSQIFHDEEIDGEAFCCLTEKGLESLVKRTGPRMKLMKVITQIKKKDTQSNTPPYSPIGSSSSMSISLLDDDMSPSIMDSVLPLMSNTSSYARKWETPFALPARFPPAVQDALRRKVFLSKQLRCKFIQIIYDRICLFTSAPTPDQRRDVCRAIVSTYSFLADASGGYEIWYRQLTDKVKNEVRNEKYDPLVLSRKRKNANGSDRSPKVSASLLRGIVNWEPPAIDGEDEHSSRAHIAWMKKEKKKKNFSNALVSKKMELTFAYRRKMINKGDLSLRSIKEEFPFLFELDQLKKEYNRLLADESAAESIKRNALSLAPKLITVAQNRNIASEEVKKLVQLVNDAEKIDDDHDDEVFQTDEDKLYIAMCLLPYLVERTNKKTPNPHSFLYQISTDPKKAISERNQAKAPFLIIGGSLVEPDEDILICGESEILMKVSGIIEAVEALMGLYYVCNIQYPKECNNTFCFIQRNILKVFDVTKVPSKVLLLMSELDKLK